MSVLVAGMLLSIALAIANIAMKQVLLASSGRESQFAFYAADAGMECALYWDIRQEVFGTSTPTTISCNADGVSGNQANAAIPIPASQNVTFSITFAPQSYCATVTVEKNGGATRVISRGYNTCDTSSPRRVERSIEANY